MSDRASTYGAGGNIKRDEKNYPVNFPQRQKKRSSVSIIQFTDCGSVIVGVVVIVCVTGDRAGEVFLGGHEEGGD